jgi:hypothetical protein
VRYIKREDAEKAVAEYLRSEDIKRYGRPRLALREYLMIAKEILSGEGRQHGETDADTVAAEQLD